MPAAAPLLKPTADDDLGRFKSIASVLDGGNGHVREAVEAARDAGSGALHAATGHRRMPVCVYLVEKLRVNVNAGDNKGAPGTGGWPAGRPCLEARSCRCRSGNMVTLVHAALAILFEAVFRNNAHGIFICPATHALFWSIQNLDMDELHQDNLERKNFEGKIKENQETITGYLILVGMLGSFGRPLFGSYQLTFVAG
ncbi:unnamed protein product [Triticum turgidum subsp. durum]|uniref:Uncharacterized protein n=1 Tax=Triticum turgidum subsp. durum TaxID=4567 RepID=A0A9R1RZU0_TRITD|nr:unnamed protein product [Triticum turgidum subsp. durum]